ncbi:PP2C family protein-serine/threonine phosphatase [Aquabacter spiritensis]|uniref:Serine/threonine protein phosphatase PrpC n=1 Tax=Aquabacter spiritensis TaxID=933073 RepID=A0A4R3LS96_9HYPH|nr:protein phosphatase 2C domain-containing protein [Aquabacter spiritensis]TCT02479.1 serine/threonine protein phosphatase PrpC [Aquabacter spiritensis]
MAGASAERANAPPLRASAASLQGAGRERNQDAYLCAPDHGLFVLADGVGGLAAGERASWGIIRTFENALPLPPAWEARVQSAEACIRRANADLFEDGRNAKPPFVMGSTLVALLVEGEHAACLWAGDSRLYLLRERILTQVTEDHSAWVSLHHTGGKRPVLTRAVGVEPEIEIESCVISLRQGDVLLLCSDGVSGPVGHDRMTHLLQDRTGDSAARLVQEAQHAGGRDDATAIVVGMMGAGLNEDRDVERDDTIRLRPATEVPVEVTQRGPETGALARLERVCWQIAHGSYSHADELFEMTIAEDASPTLRQLAESFGFMLVQVEAREMRLTGLIDDLRAAHADLEVANRRLAKENAELAVTVERLKVDIDRKEFRREVGEIVETEYFQDLQRRARDMRARHGTGKREDGR